ncbi:neuropeptide FF receptor 2-like [Actinia tenebrosa]|uniref:Neuropeptide FF receptor 2-like n=1 Tax=Actinia tenebrosa TaxID=6105 RepID=A0A6P8IUU4_ACTTE|nr:neuropeptide FF receptor 2-like [Actinia tenebrosa]
MLNFSLNVTTNSTNGTFQASAFETCYFIKCMFSDGERAAIIFVFFATFLISLVGNSFVCHIIAKSRKLKSCTNFSILNLSIADLLLTIFCIPVITIDLYIVADWVYGLFICRLVAFLQNTAVVSSILILLTISIEKFLVVCYPFQSRVYRNFFRYIIYIVWILAIVDSAAICILKKTVPFGEKTYCIFEWPSLRFQKIYLMGHGTGLFFLPLLLMTCLHTATIYVIQKKTTHRINGSKTTIRTNVRKLRQKRKAVTILVMIVVLFTISWGPFLSLSIWEAFADLEKKMALYKTLNQMFVVCLWMMFLNAAGHPVIYCFLGKEYRKAMKQSLWKKTPSSNTRFTPRDNQPAIPLRNIDHS